MTLVDRWLTRWSRNYAFLRTALDATVREIARRPYDALLQPGEELSFAQFVDGVRVDFEVEVIRLDSNGTLWVRVQALSDLPTPLRIKPAMVFRKLYEGSAYIQL